MKNLVMLLLVAALSATANAAYLPAAEEPQYNYDQFAQSMNYFNAKMYKQVHELSENKNFVFSPLSISQVVGMILAGARSNTRNEIKNVLNVLGVPDSVVHQNMGMVQALLNGDGTGPTLDVANGLFVQEQYQLYDNYTQLLEDSYHSASQSFNPSNPQEAANRINQWVAERTENMIQNLVQPSMFNPLTRLALLNAVYFNGKWKEAFEARRFPMNFYMAQGRARVKGMNLRSIMPRYADYAGLRMEFAAIPYDSQTTTTTYMVIGVPVRFRGTINLTQSALRSLSTLDPSTWGKRETTVTMPKFNVSSEVKAKKVLKLMGITDLFSEALSDLSGMSREPLHCSEFVQKSKIEVDEKGTRAAAASVALIQGRSIDPTEFSVNQPFFFGIYNVPSKMFIFMGRVEDPRQE